MSIFLGRFSLHRLARRSFSSCRCPEDGNMFSTTFKVNAYTSIMLFVYGGTFTRLSMEWFHHLDKEIKELKNEIKTLQNAKVAK